MANMTANQNVPASERTAAVQDRVDAKVSQCETDAAQRETETRKQLSSVTGLKGVFTDPFGVRRAKYRRDLAMNEAVGEACVSNATTNAQADIVRSILSTKPTQ